MRQIEDIMNRLTDMDWGWWPVVSMRPPKDKDIDNWVLFKVSLIFGGMAALLSIALIILLGYATITLVGGVIVYLLCCAAFFVTYKFTFACFWNRRAKRLRNGQV